MDFLKYKKEFTEKALKEGYQYDEIDILIKYAKKINDNDLPIIYDQEHFSRLVGYDYWFLISICSNSSYYYHIYEIPKKNGKVRVIHEPFPSLKEIQSWILKNILEPAAEKFVSPVAKAFIPKKSLRENARFHKNKNCVVALDLHDFFGTIHYQRVYHLFRFLGYSKSVCTMLTHLCLYENFLPQGAPTSPMLSNLVFRKIDVKIFSYCRKRNIIYTRYADDLTFSSNSLTPKKIISYVKMIVNANGFELNEEKTKVMRKGMRQSVTGIVVNAKMQVNRVYRDKVRQEIYYILKYGIENHMEQISDSKEWIKSPYVYAKHLYGKINYILQVNPNDIYFLKYKLWLKEYMKNLKM